MSSDAIANVTECVVAVSKALQIRGDDGDGGDNLYDVVDVNLLRLIAEFVSYGKFTLPTCTKNPQQVCPRFLPVETNA